MKVDPKWPGTAGALEFAQESLMREPGEFLLEQAKTKSRRNSLATRARYIERAYPVGRLAYRFVIPMPYCITLNVLTRKHWSIKGKLHDKILSMLLGQMMFERRDEPLGGRPLVRFVRFSVQPRQDRDASWTKIPLDVLCPPKTITKKNGRPSEVDALNIIADDSNEAIDMRAWWEPSDVSHQFVYCDIWTGEEDHD